MSEVWDLYDVLEVDPAASSAVVRAAYRRLARTLHPDRGGSGAAMSRLNAAYAVLRDPTRRAGYDASRRRAAADRLPSSPDSSASGSRPTDPGVAPPAGPPPADPAGPLARARARVEAEPPDLSGRSFAAPPDVAWTGPAGGHGHRGPDGSSILDFGRFRGWTLAQVARTDPDFLEWLERMPVGRQYQREIDACLTAVGRRGRSATTAHPPAPFARAASHAGDRRALRFAFLRRG